MSLFQEFKKFAMRGNVLDLAIAVVLGASFNKIVSSLVDGIIMPLIGLLSGGIDVTNLMIKVGHAEVKWGLFLQNVFDFFLVAFAIFIFIRIINKLKAQKQPEPKSIPEDIKLLTEIRDLLALQKK